MKEFCVSNIHNEFDSVYSRTHKEESGDWWLPSDSSVTNMSMQQCLPDDIGNISHISSSLGSNYIGRDLLG